MEQDFAQMKLMDLENEKLRKRAFEKDKRKAAKWKLTSRQARHMTGDEMLDSLARYDWESKMSDLFKEASPRFKAQKKGIDDYYKNIAEERKSADRATKAAARLAKKAETAAAKAAARAEAAAEKERKRAERDATAAT